MTQHRLLIIEDDFDVAEMLLMYFEALDYEVIHADNGTDGIEIARTKFPNLILLDVMLPDMDGYEICYRLRNMSMTKYIPTLFLTQKDERASKVKGLELGADDYITKPFDVDELRLRVEGAIRRATRDSLYEMRSGLPTGTLLEDERKRREDMDDNKELRFHLHGFTAYADVYSFMAASDALFHAGKTIRDTLSAMGRNDDFVGIEQEDFVVMTTLDDTKDFEQTVTQKFNQQVSTFYSFADADRGGILIPNADDDGDDQFLPMMSLTTGDPEPVTSEPKEANGNSLLDW